jgi:hypothetical protein
MQAAGPTAVPILIAIWPPGDYHMARFNDFAQARDRVAHACGRR